MPSTCRPCALTICSSACAALPPLRSGGRFPRAGRRRHRACGAAPADPAGPVGAAASAADLRGRLWPAALALPCMCVPCALHQLEAHPVTPTPDLPPAAPRRTPGWPLTPAPPPPPGSTCGRWAPPAGSACSASWTMPGASCAATSARSCAPRVGACCSIRTREKRLTGQIGLRGGGEHALTWPRAKQIRGSRINSSKFQQAHTYAQSLCAATLPATGAVLALFEYAEHAANCIEDHHRPRE